MLYGDRAISPNGSEEQRKMQSLLLLSENFHTLLDCGQLEDAVKSYKTMIRECKQSGRYRDLYGTILAYRL